MKYSRPRGAVRWPRSSCISSAGCRADGLLARWLPEWTSAGYAVLVTSDHGMDDDGRHNDNSEASRRVPLWLAGEGFKNTPLPADQTQIAGLVCRALGIE